MYEVSENVRKDVLKSFGKTEGTANEDVQEIKHWLATQTHFPEVMEDVVILNFLQLNKFRIEKTKEKIASYYTIRSKIADFFVDSNPKMPKQQRVFDIAYYFNYPNVLLDGTGRICFIKMKKPNAFLPYEMMSFFFSFFEIRLWEDCMVNDVIVMDMDNMTFRDMMKLSLSFCWKAFSVYKNVFAFRLKALHFLNSPVYISVWITLFKLIVPMKIMQRIHVHRDAEALKEIFSQEDLPKEYGGDGPSLDKLNELMKRKLADYQARFDTLDTFVDVETVRRKK